MHTGTLQRWAASPDNGVVYRLTTDEYDRLVAAGLRERLRVELLGGLVAWKSPEGPGHARALAGAFDRLSRLLPEGFAIREGEPVRIPPFDQPDVDLAIVRGERSVDGGDVRLVVEVADFHIDGDRVEKGLAFAIAGIPTYWLVNLVDRQVEVYSVPRDGAYRSSRNFPAGELVPLMIDGTLIGRIDARDLMD